MVLLGSDGPIIPTRPGLVVRGRRDWGPVEGVSGAEGEPSVVFAGRVELFIVVEEISLEKWGTHKATR